MCWLFWKQTLESDLDNKFGQVTWLVSWVSDTASYIVGIIWEVWSFVAELSIKWFCVQITEINVTSEKNHFKNSWMEKKSVHQQWEKEVNVGFFKKLTYNKQE